MNRKVRPIAVVLLLLAVGCTTGKETPEDPKGAQYTKIFRGRWWSYYDRGSFYLEQKQYDQSVADFRKALEGRSRDTWRARTYGLHFVEYFPNRELGIALFEAGKEKDAKPYLEQSLQQVDTVRARHYLDLVKKKEIATGALQDTAEPDIQLTFKPVSPIVAEPLPAPVPAAKEPAKLETSKAAPVPAKPAKPAPVPVAKAPAKPEAAKPAPASAAKAPAPKAPAKPEAAKPAPASAAKAPAPKEPAKPEAPKAAQAPAKPAHAPAAKEAAKPAAPAPAPEAPLKTGTLVTSRELNLNVSAKDDTGVTEVKINGQELYQRGSEKAIAKKEEKVLLNEGIQEVKIEAKDLAGKEVVKKTQVTVDLTPPTIGVFTPVEPTITQEGTVQLEGSAVDKFMVSNVTLDKQVLKSSPGMPRLDFNTELGLGEGPNSFLVSSKDVAGNENRTAVKVFKGNPNSTEAKLWLLEQKYPERLKLAMTGAATLDVLLSQAPVEKAPLNEIRLKSPDVAHPYRNERTVRVSGEVVTPGGIQSLTINGIAVENLTGARKEGFTKSIPIDPEAVKANGGKAKVTVDAVDKAGGKLSKEVEVPIQPLLVDSPSSKLPVAVFAFSGAGPLAEVAQTIRAKTEEQLVGQQRFRVLDRAKLQEALTEEGLAAALSNTDDALRLGKSSTAQIFLVGEVMPRGAKGVEVMARAVNAETGDVEEEVDAFVDDRSTPATLDALCASLAADLREKYPRVAGEVSEVTGKSGQQMVRLNWTADDKVRPGTRFILLRPEAGSLADPITQEEISPADLVEAGRGRIRQLREDGAEAVVEKLNEEGTTLEKGMLAITM